MPLWKCCTEYVIKFGKLNSGHMTGKGQFSFQSQRKALMNTNVEILNKILANRFSNTSNAQITAQLHSSHMLVKKCSKFSKPGFSNMWTVNFQMFKLVLEKAEEPKIKLPTSAGSLKKQEFHKNLYFCFIDYAKAFDCVDHKKLWKILKEMGIPDHLTFLRNLYAVQEATVRTGHGTIDWFQTRKGLCHPVYCHPDYLTYMQSTPWETLGWKKHKLESRLLGEISITSDKQMIPPLWRKAKN